MQLFRGSKHQEMVFGHHVAVVLVNLAEAGGCSAHAPAGWFAIDPPAA